MSCSRYLITHQRPSFVLIPIALLQEDELRKRQAEEEGKQLHGGLSSVPLPKPPPLPAGPKPGGLPPPPAAPPLPAGPAPVATAGTEPADGQLRPSAICSSVCRLHSLKSHCGCRRCPTAGKCVSSAPADGYLSGHAGESMQGTSQQLNLPHKNHVGLSITSVTKTGSEKPMMCCIMPHIKPNTANI